MKNVAFKIMGTWLLSAYGEDSPTKDEAAECLNILKTLDLNKLRILIYSKGGAPSAAQRKDMNEVVKGHEIPVAVLTSSKVARGAVTALSWFNSNMKAFAPEAERDAFHYLQIPPEQHDLFSLELKKLIAEVSSPQYRSDAAKR